MSRHVSGSDRRVTCLRALLQEIEWGVCIIWGFGRRCDILTLSAVVVLEL